MGSLFAAFLGYNPIKELLGPTGILNHLPAANVAVLTGKQFFPHLISGPFHHGLVIVFSMAIILLVIAAIASLLRGGRYVYDERPLASPAASEEAELTAETAIGASPEMGIEVAAEVAADSDPAARKPGR